MSQENYSGHIKMSNVMSVSLILTIYLVFVFTIKMNGYYRCFKKSFSENIHASAINVLLWNF